MTPAEQDTWNKNWCLTSSTYSPSHERRSSVSTSRIENTRGGSHMSDGKNVMTLSRYFDATARAFATRCVLLVSRTCSSPSNPPGKDWVLAW